MNTSLSFAPNNDENGNCLVGCNGDGTRYSTRVSSKERTFKGRQCELSVN